MNLVARRRLEYFTAVTTMKTLGRNYLKDVQMRDFARGCSHSTQTWSFLEVWTSPKHLSHIKMPEYHYLPGENAIFMNGKPSKIEKDVVVRFIVIGTGWIEAEREFQALVSLEVTT